MANSVQKLAQEARDRGLQGQQVNDYVHGRIVEQSNAAEARARESDDR